MAKPCVLFDLDGTLVDTALDFIWVLNHQRAQNNLPPLADHAVRNCVSGGAREMVKLAFGGAPGEKDFDQRLTDFFSLYERCFKENISKACLFPGLGHLLIQLEQTDTPWGIVTNKPLAFAEQVMRVINLKPASLICPDHVQHKKPHPEALLLACAQLHADPKSSIYIGDHPRDIDAGRNAGMKTVVVGWGYFNEPDPLSAWQADFFAANSEQLYQHIQLIQTR